LSGTFVRFTDLAHGQSPLPGGRPLSAGAVSGVVVRDSGPCAVAGVVAWKPYNPVDGLFVWRTELCHALGTAGIATFAPHDSISGYEYYRFTQRHPAQPGWSPRVAAGLDAIRAHVVSNSPPQAHRLVSSLLDGVATRSSLMPDQLHTVVPSLRIATHALAVLATLTTAQWQGNEAQDGQLIFGNGISLLTWSDPLRSGRAILRELQSWSKQPGLHPPLVVIGQGTPSTVIEGPVTQDRRSDISEAPTVGAQVFPDEMAGTRDISTVQGRRRIGCVSLARVADYYADYEATEDAARLSTLVDRLNNCLVA
jgi:hypothetical protein